MRPGSCLDLRQALSPTTNLGEGFTSQNVNFGNLVHDSDKVRSPSINFPKIVDPFFFASHHNLCEVSWSRQNTSVSPSIDQKSLRASLSSVVSAG